MAIKREARNRLQPETGGAGRVRGSEEYSRLLRQHKELIAEQRRLESEASGREAHLDFRRRLIDHNRRLHDFIVTHLLVAEPARQTTGDVRPSSRSNARPRPKSRRRRG